MSQRSSLFLNDVTIIDHAYMDEKGIIRGGTYRPEFIITGEVIGDEQVVVDFSALKKQVKAIIDDKHQGFDHKLIVPRAHFQDVTKVVGTDNFEINNHYGKVQLPQDAIRFIDVEHVTTNSFAAELAKYVQNQLRMVHYPDLNIQVYCELNNTPTLLSDGNDVFRCYRMFHYTHGLKNSSSYGCQNIAHGHRSFVQPLFRGGASEFDAELVKAAFDAVQEDVDHAVFIFRENLLSEDDRWVRIRYTTERGTFFAVYDRTVYNIHILDTETTIEHLVDYVAARHGEKFKAAGFHALAVSEGLTKGSVVDL